MGKTVQNYLIQQPLGQGNFAKVFKAKNLKNGLDYAIKVIPVEKFKDIPKLQECTVHQINTLTQIRNESQHIVNFIQMLKTPNNFYFVYEFCNGGTLEKLIQKEGFFPQQKALKFLRQILEGFKVLNRRNIMHRDLKPQNILIHNGNIKIADFSFCKLLDKKTDLAQTMLGSPIYMAPQVLRGQIYTMKADIWSMGIVLYKMLFGKCPYESKSIALLIKLLQKQELQLPIEPKISSIAQQFLRKVLVKDPNSRIGWQEMFNTYYISQQGQMFNKKQVSVQQQGQLRQSLKNGNINIYGSAARNQVACNSTTYNPTPNIVINGNNGANGNFGTLLSPKSGLHLAGVSRGSQISYEQVQSPGIDKNFAANKSPFKDQDPKIGPNFRTSTNFNSSNPLIQNNTHTNYARTVSGTYENMNVFPSQPNLSQPGSQQGGGFRVSHQNSINSDCSNGPQSTKNDRVGLARIQILKKNHAKCSQINQIVLDIFSLDQQYASYVSYFLFKQVEKQIQTLLESLKKESWNDPICCEFRAIIDSELANTSKITSNFYEAIQEQEKELKLLADKPGKNIQQIIQENKQKVLKMYIQGLSDCDQHIRLASQVIDFIQEGILIKRDAYCRINREHLYKQMKSKVFKQ